MGKDNFYLPQSGVQGRDIEYMNFREARLENLVKQFKKDCSKIDLGGPFRGKSYGHILKRKEDLGALLLFEHGNVRLADNYLRLPASALFTSGQGIKLHQCAHHLNSSQLFCLNFFYPMLDDSQKVKCFLATAGIKLKGKITRAEFEYTPDGPKHTNFDFFLETSVNEHVYFEVKYTERGFGSPSEASLKEWEKTSGFCYKKQVAHSRFSKCLDKDTFFSKRYYQVNRNIAYAQNDTDYVLFLYPFDNPALHLPPYAPCDQVKAIDSKSITSALASKEWTLTAYYKKLFAFYFG